jgi:hypothetical protein
VLHLAAKDRDLVSEHDVLKFGLSRYAIARPEQALDAAQKKIEERADHGAALSQIGST